MKLPSQLKGEDLLFDEVLNPAVRWCKSGHHISGGVKVYDVRGPSLDRSLWGNYCELCVAGAHKLARKTRKGEEKIPQKKVMDVNVKVLKAQLLRAGFVGGINERLDENLKEQWELFLEEQG